MLKLRSRFASRRARTALLALCLLGGSGYGAWITDRSLEPPDAHPAQISVAGDNTTSDGHTGWAALVTIDVHSCHNPVHVAVTLAGTLELWQRVTGAGFRPHVVSIGMSPPRISHVRLAVEDSSLFSSNATGASLRDIRRSDNGISAIVPRWWETHAPLALTFDADWVAPRALGSCYVRLPSLTGSRSAYDFGIAPARQLADYFQVITYGSVALKANDRLVTDLSTRPPTDPHDRIWTCVAPAASPLLNNKNGSTNNTGALSLPELRALTPSGSDCGGVAVLERPWAEGVHDLLLLVVGGGIGLGMALLVDAIRQVDAVRRSSA